MVAVLIAYCAWVPLQQVLRFPDRLSVLDNLQTDAQTYFELGRLIFEQGGVETMPPRHPPVWPVVVALSFAAGGVSYVTAKLVLWGSFIVLIAGCAWLASRLYGRVAAWAAALVCACSPAMHGYIGTVQYEVFAGALLLATLILAIRTIDATDTAHRVGFAVLTGLVGGILVLTREPFAVVIVLIATWMAQRVWAINRRAAVTTGLTVVMLGAAPGLAWTIVQSVRYGQLITISEKGPIVVDLGHNPLANGTYNAPLVGVGEPTGLTFARQNPGREIVLSVRKVLYFWGVLRDGWNVPRPSAVFFWRATTGLVPYEFFAAFARGGWLLIFFVISLWTLGRAGLLRWWALPATVVAIMAVHVATLSSHRFAVSVLPVVFVLISGPVAYVAMRCVHALRSPTLLGAAIMLASVMTLMQFQSWPLQRQLDGAAMDGLDAANVHDPVAGVMVRFADAARGSRPIALLADEFLPRGTVRVRTYARQTGVAERNDGVAMRISLVGLDGTPACVHQVSPAELSRDRFTPQTMTCELPSDSVATLAIVTTGTIDLAVRDVTLEWITDARMTTFATSTKGTKGTKGTKEI
jgi:4-amino-4-deoxy-L-arabinose transferase-like glycosyltransferase